jgi:hypothetical protein
MFSGCKDNQTSADAFNRTFNQYSGAFTSAFIESMKSAPSSVGILSLYRNVCMLLQQYRFTQMPMLSSFSSVPNMVITKVNNRSLLASGINYTIKGGDSIPPPIVQNITKELSRKKNRFSMFNGV